MKLYTELQLRASYESGFKLAMETDGGLKEGQEEFINSITQIELPSDRDIEIAANGNQEHYEGAMWLKYKYLTKTNNI